MRLAFPVFVPVIVSAIMITLLLSQTGYAQPAANSPHQFANFIEPDFPFITTTLNAGTLGPAYPTKNVAVRCLVLQLEHDAHACFDMDLLRVAATWTGESISLLTMPMVSYHEAGNKKNGIPEILGSPITATGVYPGWQYGDFSTVDPRSVGPNPTEAGRGPIPTELGRWNGVSVHDKDAILHYRVMDAEIKEQIFSRKIDGQTAIVRNIEVSPHESPFTLALGEFNDIASGHIHKRHLLLRTSAKDVIALGFAGNTADADINWLQNQYAVVSVPPKSQAARLVIVHWRGPIEAQPAFQKLMTASYPTLPVTEQGGPARWNKPVTISGKTGDPQGAFAVDDLTLPIPNRWRRNVRAGGIDFFGDGRAVVSTFEGDVWIVSGIDESLEQLTWKRYASGLSEPMSLSVVDDTIYTFGREGIVRLHDLNNDGEADFYENFSNLPVQTGESREYPLSMHPLAEGGFVISKNAALSAGPNTNPAIMSGFRAGGPHSGSILKVSPDGNEVEVIATGLRSPYIGLHPEEGWITASDQQGHFVPSTPVYFVEQNDYFGVPATAHTAIPPEEKKPITWIPHRVDRSGTEQVWALSSSLGPLNNTLIHLSYGKPGIYRIYHDAQWRGAISEIPLVFPGPLMEGQIHPIDGSLYVTGFQVWDSDAPAVSALSRVRYTGGNLPLPASFVAGKEGVILTFDQLLELESAQNPGNYALERWNYRRTEQYGSGHFKADGEPGTEPVLVNHATLSADQHTVFLQINEMQETMQMGLRYTIADEVQDTLKHDVYFSVHDLQPLALSTYGFSINEAVAKTLKPASETKANAQAPSIEEGKRIYQQMGCIGCHSDDGSTAGRSGSTFKDLYGSRRFFVDGTSQMADDAYIKESIFDPAARVVAGKEVEMPSYVGILDEAALASLLLFIQSLGQ